MTPDEITARLIVLETLMVGALSVALSHSPDPGQERARTLLTHLRQAANGLADEVSPAAGMAATEYARRLSELVLVNLRNVA